MNRIAHSLVVLAWFIVSVAGAADKIVQDPARDFVQTPDSVLVDLGMLRKHEILRLEMDIFGDGRTAVFLTYQGGGSKLGPSWTGYVPAQGGGYHRINGFQFRPDTYRAGVVEGLTDNGGLLVFYYGKGGVGSLIRYEIKNGVASSQQLRVLDFAKAEDKKLFASIFKREVDQPLPAEYFSKPPYQILSATSIRANNPEPRSPAPVETPKPPPARPVPSTPVPTATPPAPPAPTTPVAQTPAPVVERKSQVWPWVVGILALIVIAALALKRRA